MTGDIVETYKLWLRFNGFESSDINKDATHLRFAAMHWENKQFLHDVLTSVLQVLAAERSSDDPLIVYVDELLHPLRRQQKRSSSDEAY
jgi:hypothetical protein